jgi:hypothetical protein
MTVKLQDIADCVAEMQVTDRDAITLRNRMTEWKATYHRSHRDLMRIPGFAKLWDGLEEMVETNLHGETP